MKVCKLTAYPQLARRSYGSHESIGLHGNNWVSENPEAFAVGNFALLFQVLKGGNDK